MSEDWGAIADEVSEAIKSVGSTVSGHFSTLVKKGPNIGEESDPTYGPDDLYDIVILEGKVVTRDQEGNLLEKIIRTITVSTEGLSTVKPEKNDKIAIGVKSADYDSFSETHVIEAVKPLQPAGVVVLYKLDIQT